MKNSLQHSARSISSSSLSVSGVGWVQLDLFASSPRGSTANELQDPTITPYSTDSIRIATLILSKLLGVTDTLTRAQCLLLLLRMWPDTLQKKIGWRREEAQERVDPETGEVYQWQPPFVQMSRRPGIGGHARQWPSSWRLYAVDDGYKMPVPRFLHDSWKAQASKEEIEELLDIKSRLPRKDTSETALRSRELSAISKHSLQSLNRKL